MTDLLHSNFFAKRSKTIIIVYLLLYSFWLNIPDWQGLFARLFDD